MKPEQFDWVDSMASSDKASFVALGKRIAQLSKEGEITQQPLAELLGVAQQTLAHYEDSRLRVPASMLPKAQQRFVSQMLDTVLA